ncbi:MAG: hypothetical protein ABGZ17_23815, partial [Planctomycetaceae bacterium]
MHRRSELIALSLTLCNAVLHEGLEMFANASSRHLALQMLKQFRIACQQAAVQRGGGKLHIAAGHFDAIGDGSNAVPQFDVGVPVVAHVS